MIDAVRGSPHPASFSGINMKLWPLFALLVSIPAVAADDRQQNKKTHNNNKQNKKNHNTHKRNGDVLEGTLIADDDGRADYKLRIELKGGKASGTFEVVSESDGASRLSGTYKKWPQSDQHCPEQIQLSNEVEYVGLARNACEH